MLAYHNNHSIKTAILAELADHAANDRLVKGQYWENGKGCAVGCTVKSSNHAEYETRFGIPQMLARLEDRIFEGLPNEDAMAWPQRVMGAIAPGAELSLVGWKFLHWLLTDETANPGISHPLVKDAVAQAAEVICHIAKGGAPDKSAERSAESAARSAASAERSAAWSAASAAWSAARSAAYVRMADKLVELLQECRP